ncbi:hypothetical protein CC80DRAFT_559258, partial [Byssothecium circinans]
TIPSWRLFPLILFLLLFALKRSWSTWEGSNSFMVQPYEVRLLVPKPSPAQPSQSTHVQSQLYAHPTMTPTEDGAETDSRIIPTLGDQAPTAVALPTAPEDAIEAITKPIQDVYKAHKIPPTSKYIRVLDILPASAAGDDSTIESTLRLIDLETDPDFNALSYV